jgi:hypothetical protein
MAKLTQSQIYTLAVIVGMPQPRVMAAIAMAESGGDTRAHNPNPPDNSYGLWQINMLGGMGPDRRKEFGISTNEALFNPLTNALAAKKILSSQGLRAWSTYTNGAYQRYLGAAVSQDSKVVAGAQQAGYTPGSPVSGFWVDPFKDFWDDWLGEPERGPDSDRDRETFEDPLGDTFDVPGLDALTDIAGFMAKAGNWLSDSGNWVRIVYVVGGMALAIGGLTVIGRPLITSAATSQFGTTIKQFSKGK